MRRAPVADVQGRGGSYLCERLLQSRDLVVGVDRRGIACACRWYLDVAGVPMRS